MHQDNKRGWRDKVAVRFLTPFVRGMVGHLRSAPQER